MSTGNCPRSFTFQNLVKCHCKVIVLCMVLLLSKQQLNMSSIGRSSTCKDWLYLYGFPKDLELRKKLADQAKLTQDKWEPTDHPSLYSKHFEVDCFQPCSKLAESLGVGGVRVLLKTGEMLIVLKGDQRAAKRRRTTVEKHKRSMAQPTHHCKLYVTGECELSYKLLQQYLKNLKPV